MNEKINRLIFFSCILLCFCGCGKEEVVFTDAEKSSAIVGTTIEEQMTKPDKTAQDLPAEEPVYTKSVVVHVCGAVINPGVYELTSDSRMIDAVEAAGGLTMDAAQEHINLAGKVSDGEQIFVPTREEARAMQLKMPQQAEDAGKVNINTADKALLCTLPGIGETRAESIISYRQEHGGFSTIEDIMQVSGIKENSFHKIKELITVN